jgi:Cdc6-like AAA superfamily ATPase
MSIMDLEPQRPTITQVENAFLPAKEIDAPERFAGRKEAVQQAYYGLIGEGSHIAIVGNRGIGKTSLARQIVKLSTGNNDLLSKLELSHDRKLDFLAFYLTCGNTVKNSEDLLERLLTSKACLADWIYDVPKAAKAIKGFKPKAGGSLLGFEMSIGYENRTETTLESAMPAQSVDAIFTNVVEAISEQPLAKDGVLIVIDEFDQVSNPTGFASFLKSIATNVPRVKFCIVGVAQDIHNLMKEHESSDRLFAGAIISLPSMSTQELGEIVSIAENSINKYIQFESEARDRIVSLAQGHPYMVHLIGKYAFRHAFEQDRRTITVESVNDTMRSIAERQYDPVLEGRYKKAVASSEQREIVLKALAECRTPDGEVWTTNAYKLALDQGVDNSSQFVGQLVTKEYGEEIEKLRDRYYRFHDSLFAAYVNARPKLVQRRERAEFTSVSLMEQTSLLESSSTLGPEDVPDDLA